MRTCSRLTIKRKKKTKSSLAHCNCPRKQITWWYNYSQRGVNNSEGLGGWRGGGGGAITLLRSFLMASVITFCLSMNSCWRLFSWWMRYSKGLDLPVSKAFLARATACCSLDILQKKQKKIRGPILFLFLGMKCRVVCCTW